MKFALEENLDYWHKLSFLHYVHELEPQVEGTLSKLCAEYRALFTGHRTFDRAAFLYPPEFQEFYSQAFTYKSWKERQEPTFNLRTADYLAVSNKLLKSALEYRRSRWDEIRSKVQDALKDPRLSRELQKFSHSEDVITREAYWHAAETEETLKNVIAYEDLQLSSLANFRRMFFEDFILKFHLDREWLCLSAFLSIQEGKTKLEMPHTFTMHRYPIELLRELYGERDDKSSLCYFPTGLPYPNELPRPPAFQYDQSFHVYSNAGEYEAAAISAYGEHIRTYVEAMQRLLRSHGYKLKRRNVNYSRIKWLVRWTIQGWTMKQILDEHTENESGPDAIDESTVWKAFKSFDKYDLPVRRKKQGRATGTI
jgi:hypothetical protein